MSQGPTQNKSSFTLILLGLCLCAVVAFKFFANHQATTQKEKPFAEYTTDTKLLYYYLLYTDGLLSNDFSMAQEGLEGLVTTDPSEDLYSEAILFFLSQQEFETAVNFAERAVKRYPESQNLTVFLAEGYAQTNQSEKAIALLERCHKHNMASESMIEELIGLYLRTNQTEKAHELLAGIPESKASPAIIFFQSKLYSQQGKLGKAKAVLRSFTARYPDVAHAWLELGIVEEKLGNTPQSIEAYKRACQLSPHNEELWLHLAELQLSVNNVAGAFNTLQQHPNLGEYGFNGAILLSNHNHFDEAKVLIADSIAQGADPNEGAVLMAAIAVRISDDYKEALELLDSVSAESPYHSLALERKAQLLAHMGDCEQARRLLKALRLDNISTIEIWGIEAYCYVKEDNFNEGLKTITTALKEFPDNPDLLFTQGSIYDSMDQQDKAFAIMEKLLTISPEDPRVMNYIGYTLAEKGKDLDRALELLEAAHQAMPQAEYITDSLAWVHYKLGNYDLAWQYIQQCLALAEEDPVIWEHFADIAVKRNDRENAILGYTNALAKKPKKPEDIKKKLKILSPDHPLSENLLKTNQDDKENKSGEAKRPKSTP